MFRSQSAQFGVINGTGSSNDHARGSVVSLDVTAQIIPGQAADILFRSQDGSTQRRTLEGGSMQMVQNKFFLVLVNFGHFSQNDITFTLNGGALELGVEQDVGDDLDSLANVLLENLSKVGGLFTRGVGVPTNTKKIGE